MNTYSPCKIENFVSPFCLAMKRFVTLVKTIKARAGDSETNMRLTCLTKGAPNGAAPENTETNEDTSYLSTAANDFNRKADIMELRRHTRVSRQHDEHRWHNQSYSNSVSFDACTEFFRVKTGLYDDGNSARQGEVQEFDIACVMNELDCHGIFGSERTVDMVERKNA